MQAFVIMQIGNSQLDAVYKDVIESTLRVCALDPKRVDKHNEGRLLKSEIVRFIESADIIVADLTNERPNCYLEVGYAMGLDKFRNLILTAREDHNPDSPNYKAGEHKIHFDLSGYDILFWSPDKLNEFAKELEKRVRHRLVITETSTNEPIQYFDEDWIGYHSEHAYTGLRNIDRRSYMEITSAIANSNINVRQPELLRQARAAPIHTFGWPIGVVIDREGSRPMVRTDGIIAEVVDNEPNDRHSYDYWTIRKDGAFFLLKSIFEDQRKPGELFFNIRIVRITETLLYIARLYSGLNIPSDTNYRVGIRHVGLNERVLSTSSPARRISPSSHSVASEYEVYTEVDMNIEQTESNLVDLVEQFTQPLFVIFNFFELERGILEDIVNKFIMGVID